MSDVVEKSAGDVRETAVKRRGLFAALWALGAAWALKWTTQPVEASTALQFSSDTTNPTGNVATGPTFIRSSAGYTPFAQAPFSGLAQEGTALGGIAGGTGGTLWFPPMLCGVYGFQSLSTSPSAGVVGDDRANAGVGVLGRSGNDGLGTTVGVQGESGSGIGVRGVIPSTSSSNAIAVYGLNTSTYAGPGPGAGGFGVYGLSAKGHGLVGATAVAGGAAVVGATNGVAGAYAGAFYGRVIVGGDFTVVGGAKSAAVPHPDGSHRRLYCVESPESWFEDFGTGRLENGCAFVDIDPDFAAVVDLAEYHVFLTGHDDFDLRVSERNQQSFRVFAKNAASAGSFSWRIVAKRKDIAAPRFETVTVPPEPVLPSIPDMPPVQSPTVGRPIVVGNIHSN
jgi:hypothetical protein